MSTPGREYRRAYAAPLTKTRRTPAERPHGVVSYFWEMFDQVLVRPALADAIREVRILDSDGRESLLTGSGIPDAKNASDHLPILFRIELEPTGAKP